MRKPGRESQASISDLSEAKKANIVIVAIIAPEPFEVSCHNYLGTVTASDEVRCSTRGMIDGHLSERVPMVDVVCLHTLLAIRPETFLLEAYFCLFVVAHRAGAILAGYCCGIFGCCLITTNSISLTHLDVHQPAQFFHERIDS